MAVDEIERGIRQCGRDDEAEFLDEGDKVAGPADGDGGGGEEVFEDEVPADDPGKELAHGGIGVGVGAAGDGDHGGELRVAEAGEKAAEP